jgi:hypothetical protein
MKAELVVLPHSLRPYIVYSLDDVCVLSTETLRAMMELPGEEKQGTHKMRVEFGGIKPGKPLNI